MAAAVALALDSVFRVEETPRKQAEPSLAVMLHDLRQPLSSIQAVAYYLEMTIPAHQVDARAMLLRLQSMVDDAGDLLDRAEKRALERR